MLTELTVTPDLQLQIMLASRSFFALGANYNTQKTQSSFKKWALVKLVGEIFVL